MSQTVTAIKAQLETFLAEDAKFQSGNGAAGTRARAALAELTKLAKARRVEIQEAKNAKKVAK